MLTTLQTILNDRISRLNVRMEEGLESGLAGFTTAKNAGELLHQIEWNAMGLATHTERARAARDMHDALKGAESEQGEFDRPQLVKEMANDTMRKIHFTLRPMTVSSSPIHNEIQRAEREGLLQAAKDQLSILNALRSEQRIRPETGPLAEAVEDLDRVLPGINSIIHYL